MSKPEWKDAPEWANWLAQDADGCWCWHNSEPVERRHCWESPNITPYYGPSVGPKEPRPEKDPTVQVLIEKGTGAWEVIINGKLVASGRV